MDDKPAFLLTIEPFLRDVVWFDAFMVACGLRPQPNLEVCRICSQRLSNLARFGHLERRKVRPAGTGRTQFEYRIPRPRTVQPGPAWVPAGIF